MVMSKKPIIQTATESVEPTEAEIRKAREAISKAVIDGSSFTNIKELRKSIRGPKPSPKALEIARDQMRQNGTLAKTGERIASPKT
jgi:hypothetical protein